jgi:predicted ribosomally synthesized peptide with SipW-like signal peptide
MSHKPNTAGRLTLSVVIAILLACSLCVTTYALFYATVTVEGNYFKTGIVSIDLNNGKPVIEEHEYLFEPGMTVEKPFYIQNQSTWAVYYKLYFDKVEGGLADVLEITILDDGKVLYEGTANTLTRQNVIAADDLLLIGEKRDLTIRFHYPEESTNESQNWQLRFDLCAEAVQEKNNPNREFD